MPVWKMPVSQPSHAAAVNPLYLSPICPKEVCLSCRGGKNLPPEYQILTISQSMLLWRYPGEPRQHRPRPACVALPCGGDAREACGGKDAIIMYQDPKFTVPTVTQLAGMVFRLRTTRRQHLGSAQTPVQNPNVWPIASGTKEGSGAQSVSGPPTVAGIAARQLSSIPDYTSVIVDASPVAGMLSLRSRPLCHGGVVLMASFRLGTGIPCHEHDSWAPKSGGT